MAKNKQIVVPVAKKGRKTARDPKRQVYIYVEQSVIDKMGGMELCKDKLLEFCYAQ